MTKQNSEAAPLAAYFEARADEAKTYALVRIAKPIIKGQVYDTTNRSGDCFVGWQIDIKAPEDGYIAHWVGNEHDRVFMSRKEIEKDAYDLSDVSMSQSEHPGQELMIGIRRGLPLQGIILKEEVQLYSENKFISAQPGDVIIRAIDPPKDNYYELLTAKDAQLKLRLKPAEMKDIELPPKRVMAEECKNGFEYLTFFAPAEEVKSLVVMFHGQGSSPQHYAETAKAFQKVSPHSDVIVVQGPVPMQVSAEERAQYNLTPDEALHTWIAGAEIQKTMLRAAFGKAVPVVEDLKKFISRRLEERNLKADKLGLFGFSFGGAMAVMTGLGMKDKCAAVVSHSGVVPPFTAVHARPETLLVIGDKDFFYPQTAKEKTPLLRRIFMKAVARIGMLHDQSERRLRKNRVPFESHVVPGLDHHMNKDSAARSFEFLRQRLNT